MKPRRWKPVRTDVVYKTPIFDLHRRRMSHPRRGQRDFFVLSAGPWVNVIPMRRDGNIVMIRQWRHGISGFTLEVPGGMVDDSDESPAHAARREMVEETGYDSRKVIEIGRVHPNPAIQGNYCYSYLALDVEEVGKPAETGAEETEIVMVPARAIKDLIRSGEITHALTVAGFSFFHVYNPPPPRRRSR